MKIPKYIDELLDRRARCAESFIECDSKIAEWLENNNIDVSPDDIRTGACSLVEPWSSAYSVMEAIENAKTQKK